MTSFARGFSVIENCYSQSECDAIITHLGTITGAGTRCLLDRNWCQKIASSLKSRLGTTIPGIAPLVAVQCTFFNKSSDNNWSVAYHQDRSIPVASNESAIDWPGWSQKEGMTFVQGTDELLAQMLAVRLHVDDCTERNGPLRVFPDSHRAGTLSSPEIIELRQSSNYQQLMVKKGGVVAMRPLLLHASSKSHVVENRRVLHFLFGPIVIPTGLKWRLAV